MHAAVHRAEVCVEVAGLSQFRSSYSEIKVGGIVNLPAVLLAAAVTALLIYGTKESATVNAVLVAIKVAALSLFVLGTVPMIAGHTDHFVPFTPRGWGNP